MILLILTTFIYSAEGDTIFLEFGGQSKTCFTDKTACHSLGMAINHAKWIDVTEIVIQGHAELNGEVTFDSNADPFKQSPAEDIKYTMILDDHVLTPNTDHYGLTGHGTIVIKGDKNADMWVYLHGTKKDDVFRVEQFGVLAMDSPVVFRPLQMSSTTPFSKLSTKVNLTGWDRKAAAVIVNQGAIRVTKMEVYDPDIGVLILNDINIEDSKVVKGIVCSIPDNATNTFIISIQNAGHQIREEGKLTRIAQFPLNLYLEGKCEAYDRPSTKPVLFIKPAKFRQKYESLHISAMSQSEAYVRVHESSFIGQLSPPSRNSSTISTEQSGTMDRPVPMLKRPSTLLRPTLSQQTFLPLTTPAAHPTLPDPPISPIGEDNEGTLPPQPQPTLMIRPLRLISSISAFLISENFYCSNLDIIQNS
ncbi:hypothetical protein BLNAU_21340 [Blattamonas nauphoetae]|uniref:Uncharacterized protein n=1 Tax=Blattamonas nauphoetae TaxID=2049346 RepID=A0ABQ9WYF8_9EUKA|nr:hypothetical protein BLNAU_21340 [Blattamonas nauphoetae]